MRKKPVINDQQRPLVSILVFNYNYGRFLKQCLDSALDQTYDNIEICFSDNASEDDSWDIAVEYARKYGDLINITRNRRNFGSDANFKNCFINARGKYFIEMCSDDAMKPDYVEKCVSALEEFPDAGFAMVHRSIIDEHEKILEEPPFYNQTCLIPGAEQAAVYMMAAVNPSISQVMYNLSKAREKSKPGSMASPWYGSRILDFNICCEFPIVYIKEPLLMHRLHLGNQSFNASEKLMEVIGPYILQHQFADTASHFNMQKVVERLPASLEKLGQLCLRYAIRALSKGDERNGLRYFHLSIAISPDIMECEIFKALDRYFRSDDFNKRNVLKELESRDNLVTRTVSYDPPPGSVPISIRSLCDRLAV